MVRICAAYPFGVNGLDVERVETPQKSAQSGFRAPLPALGERKFSGGAAVLRAQWIHRA